MDVLENQKKENSHTKRTNRNKLNSLFLALWYLYILTLLCLWIISAHNSLILVEISPYRLPFNTREWKLVSAVSTSHRLLLDREHLSLLANHPKSGS